MGNPIKISAKVEKILESGNGVYTLHLKPQKRVPSFRPGQFLHLTIDDYDPCGGFWPDSRVFSIASTDSSGHITVCYSVKGKYTGRMSRELSEGKDIWVKLPYGDFVIESSAGLDQGVILVAGGTGVSPFISYLESQLASPSGRRIHLVYGVREKKLLLFKETVERCARELKGFSADLFIENNSNDDLVWEGVGVKKGVISIDHVRETAKELNSPVYFLSGPPTMINAFKNRLAVLGVSEQNIKIDEWE